MLSASCTLQVHRQVRTTRTSHTSRWVSRPLVSSAHELCFVCAHGLSALAVVVCCSVMQCVAVCCSVLQCVAVCCSVLQCVAVCCIVLQYVAECCIVLCVMYIKNPLGGVACCSALQCIAMRFDLLCCAFQCVTTCCSVLQYVSVC